MASAFMAFQHQQQSSVGALDQEQQQFRFNNSDRRQQLLNNRRANGNNSDSEDGPEGYTGGNFSGLMGFASRALDGSNKDEGIAGHSISENASMSHSRADSLDVSTVCIMIDRYYMWFFFNAFASPHNRAVYLLCLYV
jgi:hypothetical protein